MQRRQFVNTLGAVSLSAWLARPLMALQASKSPYVERIGLQLWTVRNALKENAVATLKSVAQAGYKQVELMEVLDSDELVKQAKDQGLEVRSGFYNWETIARKGEAGVPTIEKVIDSAKRVGVKHLVFGYIGKGHRETADQFKRIAERANQAAEACQKAGIQMCYHNHSFEFAPLAGDTTGYDILIKEFDPQLTKFEVDVFWVKIGGWDPVNTLRKLKGRVSQVHLKDLKAGVAVEHDESKVAKDAFQALGAGTINMVEVLHAANNIGVAECHVEQDESPDPLASIAQSVRFLKS